MEIKHAVVVDGDMNVIDMVAVKGIKIPSGVKLADAMKREGIKAGKQKINHVIVLELTCSGYTLTEPDREPTTVINYKKVCRALGVSDEDIRAGYPKCLDKRDAKAATIKTISTTVRVHREAIAIRSSKNLLLTQDITAEELHEQLHDQQCDIEEGERDQPPEERC